MGAGAVKVATPLDEVSNCSPASISKFPNPQEMSCEACSANFNLIRRKKPCSDCGRNHCSDCLQKEHSGKATKRRCTKCRLLTSGTFTRKDLLELTIKDLRYFMVRRKIPMNNCTEKVDLVEILMQTSNNSHYQQEQVDQQRHLRELQERKRQHAAEFVQPSLASTDSTNVDSRTAGSAVPNVTVTSTSTTDSGNHTTQANPPVTIEDIEDEPDDPVPTADSSNISELPIPPTESDILGPPENPGTSTGTTISPHSTRRKIANLRDVQNIDSIESLTIRQLKEILASNYVDYKGCCEKFELIERVRRLWLDKCKESERRSSASDGDLCKICMDATIDCVLLDCGHMVTCTQCGKQMSECPICRQYVIRVIHVFKA